MIPVKICGITNLSDAQTAVNFGAAAIGFIFYDKSPRYILPSTAQAISNQLEGNVSKVGVFVNQSENYIHKIIHEANLDAIQLHGDESQEFCQQFSLPVIKAIRVQNEDSLSALKDFTVAAFLLDSYVSGHYGGTGTPFDWSLAKKTNGIPIILSGGLNPNNISEAISAVNPAAVDVNSGVETSPGVKDYQKIKVLFEKLKPTRSRVNVFTNTRTRKH